MSGAVVIALVAVFAAGAAVGVLALIVIGIQTENPYKILDAEARTRTNLVARLVVNVHLRRPELPQDEEGQR